MTATDKFKRDIFEAIKFINPELLERVRAWQHLEIIKAYQVATTRLPYGFRTPNKALAGYWRPLRGK